METIRRDLAAALNGWQIIRVDLLNQKTAKNEAAFFINSLVGSRVEEIERYGKLLALRLSKKNSQKSALKINAKSTTFSALTIASKLESDYLLIHLKMTGQLILDKGGRQLAGGHSLSEKSFSAAIGGTLPNQHTRAIFTLQNKSLNQGKSCRLFFNDLRKFGYLKIVKKSELQKIVAASYGPEPLAPEFTWEYLQHLLKNRQASIKALLLNQKLIAGLGNIYVDEALFVAGILPDRKAGKLKGVEIKKLWLAIKKIIEKAIVSRGTTFSNYVDSFGKKGNFSRLLKVYGRGGQPCRNCGQLLTKKKLAGRGTHFCSVCQS